MPAVEPTFQMIVPCPICNGSGERKAEPIVGGEVLSGLGGSPLRCRACDGKGEVPARLPLSQLRTILAEE